MFTRILAALTVATALTVAVNPPASAEWDPVRYCETSTIGGVSHTWIETDLVEFDMPVMTMRNTPFHGERYLIESPVKRGPVVNGCWIRTLNGRRTAIITTRGGAEWAVINPVVVR